MKPEDAKIKLLALKKEISERVERTHRHIHREERLSADFAEQTTETENDEVVRALDDEGRHELVLIDAALDRIAAGRFGICTACGSAIKPERLSALPFAADCIGCAQG